MLLACGLVLAGCAPPEAAPPPTPAVTTTVPPTTVTTLEPTTTSAMVPEDRWIEVDGERFVDSRTGDEFVPVGVNLLRKLGGGGADRLFQAGYDPAWVDEQLTAIGGLGFNTVRFFLDMCMECTATSEGIRPEYLDALADLLTRLEDHGLVALPTSNDVPDPGFSDRLPCCDPFGGYRNSLYLSGQGHDIAVEYWTALLEGVKARGAPTHHVLGWELANEQFFLRDVAPINLSTGTVTTADGVTYDLADDAAVEAMVVGNLRSYISTVGDALRRLDDGALVTIGFFSSEEPDAGRTAGDNRWVVPRQIMQDSTLDFIDLHAYPGLGGTWEAIAPAFGLDEVTPGYPFLLGEFGAFEDAYPDPAEAAAAMARWQAESCEVGFGGWLLWFWGADSDDEVITAEAHDAVVGRAVSPRERPDPCDVGPYESLNLALGRPVTASAEEAAEYAAAKVVDGSDATWWSAGSGPPQWIDIDLEEDRTVGRVEILIGHVSAPGPQTHRVWVRGPGDPEPGTPAGEVSVDAAPGDWLTVELEPAAGVRYLRVETTTVDGWVILHEVRVLAG
jgi:hypothetical protein